LETYLLRELAVLKSLKSSSLENVVAYIGAFNEINDGEGPNALYIITEYCQGGDLLELILDHKYNLGWKFRVKLALQAATSINYLHDNNILHRDIKASVFVIVIKMSCIIVKDFIFF
jgi:serine/threonine protein kinase